MKILYVIPNYFPELKLGGTTTASHSLHKAMAMRGHQVEVFTTHTFKKENQNFPVKQVVLLRGVRIYYFPVQMNSVCLSFEMERFLQRKIKKYDLLHLHTMYRWPTTMASNIAKANQVPYLISPHGMLVKEYIQKKSYWLKTFWIQCFEKRNLKYAQGIHVTTRHEAREIKKLQLNLSPLHIVPWGINPPPILKEDIDINNVLRMIKPSQKVIVFLGRICWTKQLDRLVLAMKYIQDTHLIIAGPDEDNLKNTLMQLIVQNGLGTKITFLDYLNNSQKYFLLSRAHALILPSYSENFGNVVLEAMNVGCPVVVSRGVGLSDMVEETGVGIVVDSLPEVMGPAINQLLKDETRLAKMKDLGQKIVQERFHWDKIANQMELVYGKIFEKMMTS